MTYFDLMASANRKLNNGEITLGEFKEMIEPLEREIEPERKSGKWINVDGSTNTADCSCCGNRGRAWMNYCYECGAKMEVN